MIDGEVAAGYGPVRDVVERALETQGQGGLAVAAYVRGRPVVDLWGGTVTETSLVHTWSVVKPVVGVCALLLVARGRLSLDQPVVSIWPELRAAHDGGLRVRDVLAHAAGLVSVPPPGTVASLLDWDATCNALAAAEPDWPPGTAVGEHALTYGHLVGELVRRVDGRSLGTFLAEEVAEPLGADVVVGVRGDDLARVVDLAGVTDAWWAEQRGAGDTLRARALGTGADGALVNGAAWRRAEVPAVNGHATARGMARFWAAVLDGTLPAGAVQAGAHGEDRVLGRPVTWTLAGGQVDGDDLGMAGLGGQWAGSRPSLGVAWSCLGTVMGGFERVDAIEPVLLSCAEAGR